MTASSRISRRRLLQVGGIGTLGMSLPDLLRVRASPSAGGVRDRSPRSCIFIMQYGGASQLDTFDLKPNAPEGIRGPYRPIATAVPGIQICEMLPRLAAQADRYCLIRSMTHSKTEHLDATHICLSGHSKPEANAPYFGSIMAKVRPASRNIPSYVWLQNMGGDVGVRYLGGGALGPAYSPLRIGTNLDNLSAAGFRVTAFQSPEDIPSARLHERLGLLATLESAAGESTRGEATRGLQHYRERAVDLVTGPDARRAFDLELEPARLRDRYGRHPLGQNLLMARRLIEAGVRLVSVTAWTGPRADEKFLNVQTWDMHGTVGTGYGSSIFGTHQFGLGLALPRLDQAVSALLDDLGQRGLLEETLVVLVGEFGRTPRINKNPGRDHYGACYSALLAGAGIRGGIVCGASDAHAAAVRDRPVSPENFGATLFHALGVPVETRLGADGFSKPVSIGTPIMEIIA